MFSYTLDPNSVRSPEDQQRVIRVVKALVEKIFLLGDVGEWEASMNYPPSKRHVILTPTMPEDANLTGIIVHHDLSHIDRNIHVIGILKYQFKLYIPWLDEYITVVRTK